MTTCIPPEPALTETVGDVAISVSNGKLTICDVHAWSQNTVNDALINSVEESKNHRITNISLFSILPHQHLHLHSVLMTRPGPASGACSPADCNILNAASTNPSPKVQHFPQKLGLAIAN